MPLLAGAVTAPPTAPPLFIEDVGYAVATWTAPDGSVWPLMNEDAGYFTLREGISGLGAAGLTFTTDKRQRGGVRVRHIQPDERVITWPLHVYSDESHTEFTERWRQVMRAFTMTTQLGPGWLEIARPDGSARRVAAYYQQGFEGAKGLGVLSDQAVVTLLCEDPYWQAATPAVIRREHAVGTPFLAPFPTVSSGQVLGDTTLFNPGDVEAWPEWVITGPATSLTATLHTTGQSFTLTGTLLAGEQATIRTNPAQVRGPGGAVWTGNLDWPSAVLWGLPPGEHAVTFAVSSAAPGTSIELTFYPRYESA